MMRATGHRSVGLVLVAAVVTACGSAGPVAPAAQHDAPAETCAPKPADAPSLPVEQIIDSPPAGTTDGTLVAVDAGSGKERWRRTLPMATADLVVDGPRLVIKGSYGAGSGGRFASVDAATGAVEWRWPEKGWLQYTSYEPVSAGDGVVLADSSGLTVLDAASGTPLWGRASSRFGGGTVAAGAVIRSEPRDGSTSREPHTERLVAYAACTGAERWSTGEPALRDVFGPVADSDAVTAYADETGQGTGHSLVRVDATSGRQVWRVDLPGHPDNFTVPVAGPVTALEFTDTTASKTTRLALDPGTGRELWRLEDRTYWLRTSQADGRVYFVGDDGQAQAVDAKTGHVDWQADVDRFGWRSTAGHGLLLLGTRTAVLALDGATGRESWRLPNPSDVDGAAIPVAVDGDTVYVWEAGAALRDDE